MTLIFNPATKKNLQALLKNMPQAVLLTGQPGAGLQTAARYLAGGELTDILVPHDKDGAENHSKGNISVKRIRELYDATRGKSLMRRMYILDDADTMTHGAQNAFLKLLEEPNDTTHFILTSHSPEKLLPTVRSRVETIAILPITAQQTADMVRASKMTGARAAQSSFMALGKPAELHRLSADDTYFAQKTAITADAKVFLQGTKPQRVALAYAYSENRERALELLRACQTILLFSIKNKPNAGLIATADSIAAAYDAIYTNGNTRLHLIATMV